MKRPSIIEVDQSIKIGDLSADTVLAYSNHEQCAVVVRAADKRLLLSKLRARGKSTIRATVQLFAAAVSLLLMPEADRFVRIVIDTEYSGYEADIKGMVLAHLWNAGASIGKEQIQCRQVGKTFVGAQARDSGAPGTRAGSERPDC